MDKTPQAKRGKGRPRKQGDLAFPQRKESQKMIEELRGKNAGETSDSPQSHNADTGNKGFDNRPIGVSAGQAAPEVADKGEDQAVGTENKEAIIYECGTCEIPVLTTDRYCPGCGNKLRWGAVNG